MREALIDRVQALAARLGHLGVKHDLAGLALADLWGLYRYLHRMANG